MVNKVKSAEDFLKKLEDSSFTMEVMLDRVDLQSLQVITNYSQLIAKVKSKTNIEEKDVITCSMIIGYLLKTHIDRYDLEERLQKNNL